jgi:hypothetical protein
MTKRIKMYGERNTNTNYMSRLIELNLDAQEIPGIAPPIVMALQKILPGNELVRDIYFNLTFNHNLGWKHSCVAPLETLSRSRIVDSDLAFITITKNPYTWLLSLHRRPYHQYYSDSPSFETFLRRPWKTIARDNVGSATLKNPIELWNIKNRSYLQLNGDTALNITSESIIESPDNIIDKISNRFGIQRRSAAFIDFNRSTKDKGKDANYYRDYYLNERWRREISSEAFEIINQSVDRQLMSHFDYTFLSP